MTSSAPAALWIRLVATIYDLFALVALWMVTGAFALVLTGGSMDARHPPLIYRFALFVVTGAYFVISWMRGGQTLGMRPWRLKLTSMDGKGITLKQACVRFAAAWMSLLLFGLGFFWTLIDPEHRTWHDRMADTQVLRTH